MTPRFIVLHHSAGSPNQTIDAINSEHKRKDWGNGARISKSKLGYYIAYHYVIAGNGQVTQTCLDTEPRWHSGSARNSDAIAICLLGNFDANGSVPTKAQTESLQKLLRLKVQQYNIPLLNITPHRAWTATACYGKNIKDSWGRDLAKTRVYHQITDPKFLSQYTAFEIEKLKDGRIVLKEGVVPKEGTTKSFQ